MSGFPDRTPVVIAARRTPIGTAGHALAGVDLVGLLAPVLRALVDDLGPDAPGVDEVVIGNCRGPGGNPARVAALAAGLGIEVPGVTVDRQCGSGQEAVHQAATAVLAGAVDVVLAGGAESASTAPWRLARPATSTGLPTAYERAPFAPSEIGDPDMGPAAEAVAAMCGVTRQRQDAYASRSHALTLAAARAGAFDVELVPVGGMVADERPRQLTEAVLSRLRPAFVAGGTVTAGNCCGVSDGAAAVAVVPERLRAALGVPGLALRGWVCVGLDPNTPGLGPVPAVAKLLKDTGIELAEVGVVEMTEAFAAQVLACTDALGLDPLDSLSVDAGRVCPQGGAIAMGHPWGASGAMLLVRLFAQMVRVDGPRLGIATCAIGGGQGLALLAERVG
ncbi:MAG TPA: thiolase family protein [Dermatophilaceae bacterium]|jgi:acetyl-CoA C-acetyltransferase|nr:thiolase family protein [Dermatophilaceae bacterium]